MPGFGNVGQLAIGQTITTTSTAENISPDKWFVALSEPARFLPGLAASRQQAFIAPPFPPVVPFSWFVPLSEPAVKTRPGLRPSAQQFSAMDTQVIPRSLMLSWFAPLSEPVRTRPGLKPGEQQFLAAPSQLRPNPTVTATLRASENKDSFLAGALAWNTINSAEMGVIASNAPSAEIGVAETAPALTARMSISPKSS